MVSIEEAHRLVLDGCEVLPAIDMHVDDSIGCVLDADAVAAEDVPPFANTAVDG